MPYSPSALRPLFNIRENSRKPCEPCRTWRQRKNHRGGQRRGRTWRDRGQSIKKISHYSGTRGVCSESQLIGPRGAYLHPDTVAVVLLEDTLVLGNIVLPVEESSVMITSVSAPLSIPLPPIFGPISSGPSPRAYWEGRLTPSCREVVKRARSR